MSGLIGATEKLYLAFNKFYFDFIKDLNKSSSKLKEKNKQRYKIAERTSAQYFDAIKSIITEDIFKVFLKSDNVLEDVNVQSMKLVDHSTIEQIKEELKEEDHIVLKSYVYIFVLLVHIHNEFVDDENVNNKVLETVLIVLGKIQNDADISDDLTIIMDEDIKTLLNHIKTTYERVDDSKTSGPKLPFDFNPDMIENTSIGNLAKEIAQEIDLSDVKIEKPEDIFNLANFTNNDNVIGNIVNKVGSKLQNKLTSGELKQDQLINEAMSFFNVMSKNNNMFNNPLMKDILKNVAGGNARINESKLKSMSTKDRLRRKLDEKQKS